MEGKKWFIGFIIELFLLLTGVSLIVIVVDPYFHYHKPVRSMFYSLNNERSQNDGILKHFEYDAVITGTSMAQNFKTSEFNEIFGTDAVKVCFSGGSYKEINENLQRAFDSGHEIKYVLRCLDYGKIIEANDTMRSDLGEYPEYLYDYNIFNDVKYILNKEIVFKICLPMLIESYVNGKEGGRTSFDEYSFWGSNQTYGGEIVLGDKKEYVKSEEVCTFTEREHAIVQENIEQNVIKLAREHPDTIFYYFFSPYSIAYWAGLYEAGKIDRQIDAEQYAIELILTCPNIKLYSFNNCWDITTDLNNYKDSNHYGDWINTDILRMIYEGTGLLTEDNYQSYIDKEREFYSKYTYRFYDIDEK